MADGDIHVVSLFRSYKKFELYRSFTMSIVIADHCSLCDVGGMDIPNNLPVL